MSTDPARFRRLMDLVGDALELPEAERASWVVAQCGTDEVLRGMVESLLAHGQDAALAGLTGRLRRPIAHVAAHTVDDATAPRTGTRVGAYRLVSEIGRGGMGTVYLAARADEQYRAWVAIKFVRGLLAAPELERRFRAERQILADLNHPNIARLLDGGADADGTPYLVMEYVDGQQIDAWCDAQELGVRARVELFRHVCDAVAYAHRSGVVHRDLKPSNILVTREGVPKLVDFGVAKLVDVAAESEPTTLLRVMTPTHASPEQIRGGPIAFATDVYSLGIVLYELLAGRPPFVLEGTTIAELERQICTVRPVPPSAAAAARGAAWQRELADGLDEIVLHALEKEPQRRHASVDAFAAALQRDALTPPRSALGRLRQRARGLARRPSAAAFAAVIILLAAAIGFSVRIRSADDLPPLRGFTFMPLQQPATPIPLPHSVHTADVNGDGRADLIWNHLGAEANLTLVALAGADGRFSFQPVFTYAPAPAAAWNDGYELVPGDFNGDGRVDLAWYQPRATQKFVHLALSNGDGTFRTPEPQALSLGWVPGWRLHAADAHGRARDDLVATLMGVENIVRIFRSNGDATFELTGVRLHVAQYWTRYSTHFVDVDGDGRLDILYNDVPDGINRLYVVRSLEKLIMLPWQDHPLTVAEDLTPEQSRWAGHVTHVGDIDGDRRTDLAWIAPDRDPMPVHRALAQASGQYRYLDVQEVARPPHAGALVSHGGDFNGDGRADILLHEAARGRMWIGFGSPDGSFDFAEHTFAFPAGSGAAVDGLLIADVTGNGRSDVIRYDLSGTNALSVALSRP